MASITIDTLKSTTGASDANANKFLPYVNSAMKKYSINTPARILAFLSQIGHESGHLKYTEELASGSAYEGRSDLGNTKAGDGVKYKGRGAIQITGKSNYTAVGKALGIDAVNNPELLAQPKYALEASAWWWKKHGLNEIADKMDVGKDITDPANQQAYKKITQIINGGQTGASQRISNWQAGRDAVLEFARKNPITVALGFLTTALLIGTTIYYLKNKKAIEAPLK